MIRLGLGESCGEIQSWAIWNGGHLVEEGRALAPPLETHLDRVQSSSFLFLLFVPGDNEEDVVMYVRYVVY